MKRLILNQLMWILLVGVATSMSAQQSTYTKRPGYWTLGLNGGLAYQQSDVSTRWDGWGAGLTLGKNLYYAPGAPFSFDLRGRLLYTRTYGLGTDASNGLQFNDALNGTNGLSYTKSDGSTGFVFQNHKTDLAELGLEGVLTFNQLRENTGVIFSLYGGIGLDWYNTKLNQKDGGNSYEDAYAAIDTFASKTSIRKQLRNNILDDTYETNAHSFGDAGKLTIMPSLGFELGYQLAPRFSMGLGHRITWARNDLLDGQQWNDDNSLTDNNDLHHYTSLHMRWDIQPKEPEAKLPHITWLDPSYSPYKSNTVRRTVRAKIEHVNSSMDITAKLNGYPLAFDFRGETFTANVELETGTNEIEITARNLAGSDQESTIITLRDLFDDNPPPPPSVSLPQIKIINPSSPDYYVQNDRYTLRAEVDFVDRKNDIRFVFNGKSISNYDFDARNGTIQANLNLEEGRNTVRISVSNKAGNDEDRTSIIYEPIERQAPPTVRITRPNANPHRTDNNRVTIEADIRNIENKRQIRFEVNGRSTDRFEFRGNFLRAELSLQDGRNIVSIEAANEEGEDRDEISVYYDKPLNPVDELAPPVVNFTDPNRREVNVKTDRKTIRANVRNVDRRSDIRMTVNNRNFTNFDFNNRNGLLTATIDLKEGRNTVEIRANNSVGRDEADVRINYERSIVIQPKRIPTVNINRPGNRSTSTTEQVDVRAAVRYVGSKSDLELFLNDRKLNNFAYNNRKQELTATLDLEPGNNSIKVIAYNADGQAEDEVSVTYEVRRQAPVVTITKPTSDGKSTSSASTQLEAKVLHVDGKSAIRLEVNNRNTPSFSYDTRTKMLKATIRLKEGKNTFTVTATNKDGKDEDNSSIYYKTATVKTPPVVTFTDPSQQEVSVKTKSKSIRATVLHVDRRSDIRMTVNNRNFTNFDFNSRNQTLTASIDLNEGRNTVKITANNKDGSDQADVRINYKKAVVIQPKRIPIVKIMKPADRSKTSKSTADVKASVKYVKSKSDIELFLNDRKLNDFSFNLRRQEVTAKVNLVPGNNFIKVVGTNADGQDEDEICIAYEQEKKQPPVVTITKPTSNGKSTTSANTQLEAKVLHVGSKSDIRLEVNNRNSSSFSYDARTKVLKATVRLKKGKNTFKITATNKDGKDDASISITRKIIVNKPTVSFVKPAKSGTRVRKLEYAMEARVKNIGKKDGITVYVNNKKVDKFDFNAKSGKVTATVVLKGGANELKVVAKNTAGEAEATTSISTTRTISRPGKIKKPTISELQNTVPVVNPLSPSTGNVRITATVKNITKSSQLTFRVNQQEVTNFTFDPKTGKFTAVVKLKKGETAISLKASNEAGDVVEEKTIKF